ncbi:MAG TPA: Fic/DOC family N-terminal domain-containing protein [Fimbriimonas sp.]|nr:Fic/DOC family N-terminal domain-containing protein [Fimbriimonas sp.]
MKPCVPIELPPDQIDWKRLVPFIGAAREEVGRYDGLLASMINAEVLLSPLLMNEAVLSSKMEGTVTTLQEVLRFDADEAEPIPEEQRNNFYEVLNYRKAMNLAKGELQVNSITLGFVRRLHHVLMQGVRGQDKSPGAFRTVQNHIGRPKSSLEEARFVPPSPLIIQTCLENLEQYMGSEEMDPLVQAAIMHAQFEIIHPFMDGNGRVGRILIPLIIYNKRLLSSPVFYFSSYLEHKQDEYNDRLLYITEHGDWNGWIEFFLVGVTAQATANSKKVKRIMDLYSDLKVKCADITHSQFVIRALDAIFMQGFFTSSRFASVSGIPKQSASRILSALQDAGLIAMMRPGSGRRAALYMFGDLLRIADEPDFS